MKKLEKKYGLFMAIAMVAGVAIGSGIFYKADDVLNYTNGNLILSLVAWIVGAFAMIFGSIVFGEFAQRIEKSNGFLDYFEHAYGERIGYLTGWFKVTLYLIPIASILAWLSSLYTMILFKVDDPKNSFYTWTLAFIYLTVIYLINYFSPKIAGYLQISSTILKLIPLMFIAVTGIVYGLYNGVTYNNFTTSINSLKENSSTIGSAIVATAFAYEGWIVAITINNEIKDSKKNLPKALIIGTIIVLIVYVSYFLGLTSILDIKTIITKGDESVALATSIFGSFFSVILTVFIVISCLGTLNGLIISSIRTQFSIATRNQGPFYKQLSKVDKKYKMPYFASIYTYIITAIYITLWYGSFNNWYGKFISIDEIPIVMIYTFYIALYLWAIKNFKELKFIKRFLFPSLAILGSIFILYGGILKDSIGIYLIISFSILGFGLIFYKKERNIK